MERLITINILREWEFNSITKLVLVLNQKGIVSDEDSTGLSSTMIERWNEDCDDYLRECGYKGGELKTTGNFIAEVGAVYVIYDSECISYEQAQKYIDAYAS